jgi:hypothetical protein
MFMHGSWSHIIGNMVFLWAFGPEIEDAMTAADSSSFVWLADWWPCLPRFWPILILRFQTWARVEPSLRLALLSFLAPPEQMVAKPPKRYQTAESPYACMKRVNHPDVTVLKNQAAVLPSCDLLDRIYKKVGPLDHLARLHTVALTPYNNGR